MNPEPSILVVDDELLIRDLLYDFFTGQGWDIAVAESSQKALNIMRQKKVDLVLSDIMMPEMDGMDLTVKLRQEYPEVPVVVMTGYPSVESAIQALRQRVADYVTKPFNINELYKSIERHLEESRAAKSSDTDE